MELETEKTVATLKREALEAKMKVVRLEAERDALREQLDGAYQEIAQMRTFIQSTHWKKEEEEKGPRGELVKTSPTLKVVMAKKQQQKEEEVEEEKGDEEGNRVPYRATSAHRRNGTLNERVFHMPSMSEDEDWRNEQSNEIGDVAPLSGAVLLSGESTTTATTPTAENGLKEKLIATAMVLQGVATALTAERKSLWSHPDKETSCYPIRNSSCSGVSSSVPAPSGSSRGGGRDSCKHHNSTLSLHEIFSEMKEDLSTLISFRVSKDEGGPFHRSTSRSFMPQSLSSSFSASSFSYAEEAFFTSSPLSLLDAILEALMTISRFFSEKDEDLDNVDTGAQKEKPKEKGEEREEKINWYTEKETGAPSASIFTVPITQVMKSHGEDELQKRDIIEEEGKVETNRTENLKRIVVSDTPISQIPENGVSIGDPRSPLEAPFTPLQMSTGSTLQIPTSTSSRTNSRASRHTCVMPLSSCNTLELYGKALYRVGQAYGGLVRDVRDLLFQKRVLQQELRQVGRATPTPSLFSAVPRPSAGSLPFMKYPRVPLLTPLLWWRVRVIAIVAVGRFLRLVHPCTSTVTRTPSRSWSGGSSHSSSSSSTGSSGTGSLSCCSGRRECTRKVVYPLSSPLWGVKSSPRDEKEGKKDKRNESPSSSSPTSTPPPSSSSPLQPMVVRIRMPPSSSCSFPCSVHHRHYHGEAKRATATPRKEDADEDAGNDFSGTAADSEYSIMMSEEVEKALEEALEEKSPDHFHCPIHRTNNATGAIHHNKKGETVQYSAVEELALSSSSSLSFPPGSWCEHRRREADAEQIYSVLMVLQQVIEGGGGAGKDAKSNSTSAQRHPYHPTNGNGDDGDGIPSTVERENVRVSLLQGLGQGLSDYLRQLAHRKNSLNSIEPTHKLLPGQCTLDASSLRSSKSATVMMESRRIDPASQAFHPQGDGWQDSVSLPPSVKLSFRKGVGEDTISLPPYHRISRTGTPSQAPPSIRREFVSSVMQKTRGSSTSTCPSSIGFIPAPSFSSSTFSVPSGGTGPATAATDPPGPSLRHYYHPNGVDENWRKEARGREESEGSAGGDSTLSGLFAHEVLEVISALDDHLSSALTRCKPSSGVPL